MNLLLFLLVPLALLPLSAAAQNKVLVRIAAQALPPDIPEVVMRAGEEISPPFEISTEFFCQPQAVPARNFALRAVGIDRDFAQVRLPEKGGRFMVLLVMAGGGKMEPVVIPDDRNAFRGGDVHAHNTSDKTIQGLLGTTKFQLPPRSGRMVRPAGIVDEQFYEVRFAYQDGATSRMFSSARWPAGLRERSYVFFYNDPRKPDRMLYRVISEVLLPEENPG